jgi:hypothetical protein
VNLDVTAVVTGNGTYSFNVAGASADNVAFRFREATNAGRRPKQLYDLVSDPYELENLTDRPEYATIQAGLAERLQVLKQRPPLR